MVKKKTPKARGRGGSPARPGIFIRAVLSDDPAVDRFRVESTVTPGEEHPSALHRAYKNMINEQNGLRPRAHQIRAATFPSFYRYLKHLQYFGLIELSGTVEDTEYLDAPLQYISGNEVAPAKLHYYRLTASGSAEPPHQGFNDPVTLWKSLGRSYE